MGKIFFSFKKEHQFIIYMGITQIIGEFILDFKKRMIDKNENSSIIVIATYLGNFAIIILYYFENLLSKRNKYVKYISNINNKNKNHKYLEIYRKHLLLICVFISRIIYNLFQYHFYLHQIQSYRDFWTFKIDFFSLIIVPLIIISKDYFYSHHYFSLALLFLSFVFDYLTFNVFETHFILNFAYVLNKAFINAICLNIYAFLNKYEFMNIYLLASIEGLINLIDIILIECIMKIFNLNALHLYQSFIFFFDSQNLRIVCYIYFIFEFIYRSFFFTIIRVLDPSFTPLGYLINVILYEIFFQNSILRIMSLIICLLGCLIYLEILIIDKYGLGTNVKINIKSRASSTFLSDIEFMKHSTINEDSLEKTED